jgi:LacI family transcriptional regulator, repressor for deo operon, udp, cdd, tsx, nupC, and nupG
MTPRRVRRAPATSVDVARRAGVSQSAVSLVFSGKADGRVSRATEAAILKAGRQLDYRPHNAGRSLRVGRSRLLVLAVPDVRNPYFAQALTGAEREARKHGYAVTLATVRDKDDWKPVIGDALSAHSVDGFLFFTLKPPTAAARRALTNRAVFVDASTPGFPSVQLDLETGVRAAMDHLRGLGHTRIGHVGVSVQAPVDEKTFERRRKTYERCLREAGIRLRSGMQKVGPFSLSTAFDAALDMFRSRANPTAIFCDSDVLAAGVYKAAQKAGRVIPRDLSVVSIDDSLIARILAPELTTVAIPAQAVGEQAIRLLVDQLSGTAVSKTQRPVPLTLLVRHSTAPVSPS